MQERRELIDSILTSTQQLSDQLSGPGRGQPRGAHPRAAAARHGDRHPGAQPRQPRADGGQPGAVRPRLHQHPRQRPLVRQLRGQPAARRRRQRHLRRTRRRPGCPSTARRATDERLPAARRRPGGRARAGRPRWAGPSCGRPASTRSPPGSTRRSGSTTGSDVRILGIEVGDITDVDPAGRPGAGGDADRRGLRHPGRRRRRRPRALAGLRPLRAVRARLRRRPDAWRTAPRSRWSGPRPRSSSTGSTARSTSCRWRWARPGQRERRAVRPRRRRRGEPRRQRRRAQPHPDRLLPGGGDAVPQPRRPVRLASTTCRPSPARWPRSTPPVGQFNTNMAAVADLLEQERADLARAVQLLSAALGDVAGFVRTNTDLLTTNVDKLADVTLALVQQRSRAGRGARRRPGGAGQPRARLQPRLRHAGHPGQLAGPPAPRSSSASCCPRPAGCSSTWTSSPAARGLQLPPTRAGVRPAAVRRRGRRRRLRRPQRQRRARPAGAARRPCSAAPAAPPAPAARCSACPRSPGAQQ